MTVYCASENAAQLSETEYEESTLRVDQLTDYFVFAGSKKIIL